MTQEEWFRDEFYRAARAMSRQIANQSRQARPVKWDMARPEAKYPADDEHQYVIWPTHEAKEIVDGLLMELFGQNGGEV